MYFYDVMFDSWKLYRFIVLSDYIIFHRVTSIQRPYLSADISYDCTVHVWRIIQNSPIRKYESKSPVPRSNTMTRPWRLQGPKLISSRAVGKL